MCILCLIYTYTYIVLCLLACVRACVCQKCVCLQRTMSCEPTREISWKIKSWLNYTLDTNRRVRFNRRKCFYIYSKVLCNEEGENSREHRTRRAHRSSYISFLYLSVTQFKDSCRATRQSKIIPVSRRWVCLSWLSNFMQQGRDCKPTTGSRALTRISFFQNLRVTIFVISVNTCDCRWKLSLISCVSLDKICYL